MLRIVQSPIAHPRARCVPSALGWRAIVAALTAAVVALAALPAAAFDLAEAEAEGALVRVALAAGEDGRWDEAQALVAGATPLVRDIVLWRKLRSGAGSVREYQSFVTRNPDWPGQSTLASKVLGDRPASPSSRGALVGETLERWRRFDRLYDRRQWDEAEVYLADISTSEAALGDPGRYAKRRLVLARRAARQGRPALAYRLAADGFTGPQDGYNHADLQWVAGWVALRLLNDPGTALGHFQTFAGLVNTPISNGRAGYWIGRSHEAMGNVAAAETAYAAAAVWQTSFYGQLAAAKIDAAGDQALADTALADWRRSPVVADDAARMAAIVHYAGEDSLAWQSFRHLARARPDRSYLEGLAGLALAMGEEHYAVRVAKEAARHGVIIMPAYYPVTELADAVTRVEPAFAMSVARQETELNPRAISRVGARGLMQLMPGTAEKVASWLDLPYEPARLTADWRYNATLGQTYLGRRVDQLGGSYVLAAAAYNAGKGRVDNWVVDYGHPLLGEVDMIDWMEMIPFSETRNYVQRVMEGIYVYRTRLSGAAGPMTIERDLARGIR